MTPEQFEKRWRYDLAHAERTLLRDGHVSPLFIIVGADGGTSLVPGNFSDGRAKAASMDLARLQAVAADAEAVLLRTESWMVLGEPLAAGVAPSESDRRLEVVSLAATARVGKQVVKRLSAREIIRGPEGRPTGLRDLRLPEGGPGVEAAGSMFDLLPPVRPTAEQRAMAAMLVEAMRARAG